MRKSHEEESNKLRELLKQCDAKIGDLETRCMNKDGEIKTLK